MCAIIRVKSIYKKIQIRTFIPENVAQLVRSLRYVAREVYVAATLHV